jgi:hypothetical protein
MPQLFNRVGMASSTSGTGTVTLGAALGAVAVNSSSWQSFATAGVPDQTVVSYLILDSNDNWEAGTGTYTVSGTSLSRTVKYSSNSNALISLSGTEQVFITGLASDGGDMLGGTTFPMRGFDTPVNCSLTSSVNASLLTINVLANNGSNPSPTNPVFIPFRDSTASAGDPIWRIVTSALSINTNSVGASLGTSANTAFRFWVAAFDNGGTVVLALINCSTATRIFPLNETLTSATTNMSGSATSAGVFYTPSGTTLAGNSFRILGFVEYNSTGLVTPGTYSRAPDFMQLFGPGVKKPGDIIQTIFFSTSSTTSISTTAKTSTALTTSLTPTSAANLIRANGSALISVTGNGGGAPSFQLSRGSGPTLIGTLGSAWSPLSGAATAITVPFFAFDNPNTTSSQAYTLFGWVALSGSTWVLNGTSSSFTPVSTIELTEIMG